MKISPDLHLAFDVGHSSIGWAVLQHDGNRAPNLLGCGSVIFQADDCLASQRRQFRRQRRHIRATRLRIARMKRLLAHLGVLTQPQLDKPGCAWPWLLAARVLRGGDKLTWPELWDVLRWYAHNRGYDGNKAWSAHEADIAANEEDTEKVENARALYTKHGTRTMAETWCSVCGLDPLGEKKSVALPGHLRPRGLNAAFPREDVEAEVERILRAHLGGLTGMDESLITALLRDHTAVAGVDLHLPRRYGQILADWSRSPGGVLFGQLMPRFDNRIIARCPITWQRVHDRMLAEGKDAERAKHEADKLAKVPAKDCPEFYRFRWAMQLANVQIATGVKRDTRPLEKDERAKVNAVMEATGFLTPGDFKKTVREITGTKLDNLDQMLTHPDAGDALILDPARKAVASGVWERLFPTFDERVRKHALTKLRRGHSLRLGDLVVAGDAEKFNAAADALLTAANTKKARGQRVSTREELLALTVSAKLPTGRAPFSREVMYDAATFVFDTGRHPTEGTEKSKDNGPLFRSEAIRHAQLQRAIDEQTNNHLVRHRLRLLEKLHEDLVKSPDYANGDSLRIARIAIEVNRDLRELSGKTAKQVAQDLGQRLANFKSVVARLEKAFDGKNVRITPGLIRKARIAEDLGWKCPYTGQSYDEFDLLHRKVDKDHIIPRSDRASDSLDSLAITFSAVNKMKGKRTAALFIEECQSQPVEGMANVSIRPLNDYKAFVEKLETFKGHDDDKRRKKRRKEKLLLRDYVEKTFTPGDLTQTSQLVRLGAEMLGRSYLGAQKPPVITSIPGSVTGSVRKSWDLIGCLATGNPGVINPDEKDEHDRPKLRTKTEIRDITHLHHALDACVLGFADIFIPRDGGVWELLVQRRLDAGQQAQLRKGLGTMISFSKAGQPELQELPKVLREQIRRRLAERRVVQHIPAEIAGLSVEQNAWRVVDVKDGVATIRQRNRQPDGSRPQKQTTEKVSKLLGLSPDRKDGGEGKLAKLKAALVIPSNYGLALDPEPEIIPFHKVWNRLRELREKNGGKAVRVLRNGMLIQIPRGNYEGVWRIFSAKNNTSGMALDIGRSDVVRLRNKTEGHKINVLLSTLIRDGLKILPSILTGHAAVEKKKE
jgi:CRISPR-associated endonuclease Csn1